MGLDDPVSPFAKGGQGGFDGQYCIQNPPKSPFKLWKSLSKKSLRNPFSVEKGGLEALSRITRLYMDNVTYIAIKPVTGFIGK
jgi:hypothetical protein